MIRVNQKTENKRPKPECGIHSYNHIRKGKLQRNWSVMLLNSNETLLLTMHCLYYGVLVRISYLNVVCYICHRH